MSRLSCSDGNESLRTPNIRRHLDYMFSSSSARYFGIPPQIGGWPDILPKDTLPKDTLPKDILPKDISPNGHFADGHLVERTFCRTDSMTSGLFAEKTFCRNDNLPKIEKF